MLLTVPRLPLACYRLRFRAMETIQLPHYAGSAWRGVFGNSLKKLVCVTRARRCEPCLLYRSCIYPYIFETPPDPEGNKLRKYNAAPHPFVLCPGATMHGPLPADSEHSLALTLFGHGNRQLPYIIHALERAARRGLGKNRGKLELLEVEQQLQDNWLAIYRPGAGLKSHPTECPRLPDCPTWLKLRFHTPLRIRFNGHLVTPERFTFQALFSSLLRRISLLTTFHGDTPLETDFAGLGEAAAAIPLTDNGLRWHEWTCYSSRQHSLMQLGGLTGTATFQSDDLGPFWPYLWLGQWTHAGKNTSMGLGKYEIVRSGPDGTRMSNTTNPTQ